MHGEVVAPTGSIEVRAERAHQLNTEIAQGCQAIWSAWMTLASRLWTMNSERLYELLGHDTFGSYLADLGLSKSHAYALIGIHDELVIEHQISPEDLAGIEPTKLAEALPAIRDKRVEVLAAVADARVLSKLDMREKYRHDDESGRLDASKAREVCPNCGNYMDPKGAGA